MRPLVTALSSLDLSDGICKFVCTNINESHLQTLKIGGDQILHKVPFLQQFFAVHTCTCSSNLFSTDYIFFSHFLLNKLYVLIFAFFLGTPGMSETKLEIQKKNYQQLSTACSWELSQSSAFLDFSSSSPLSSTRPLGPNIMENYYIRSKYNGTKLLYSITIFYSTILISKLVYPSTIIK